MHTKPGRLLNKGMFVQDGEGLEIGSEEDGGMYSEEQDVEQYEYTDEQGEEGADDDANLDPQENDMQTDAAQTDMQDEDEQELAEAAEGDDDIDDQAEALSDYPVLARAAILLFLAYIVSLTHLLDSQDMSCCCLPCHQVPALSCQRRFFMASCL